MAWRNDVGAYVLFSYPSEIKVDGQDLMNLYNLHRFRTTDKNFQLIKHRSFNAASFYSGGYKSSYIAKPNYCVSLLLNDNENPLEYEKVLLNVSNYLLSQLDNLANINFDTILRSTFLKLDHKKFDEFEVFAGDW